MYIYMEISDSYTNTELCIGHPNSLVEAINITSDLDVVAIIILLLSEASKLNVRSCRGLFHSIAQSSAVVLIKTKFRSDNQFQF